VGIPLSDLRLPKPAYQPSCIDNFAKLLAGWKALLLSITGRHVLVRFVPSDMPIFQLIAIDMPKGFKSTWISLEEHSSGRALIRSLVVNV
jgi:hypothetical protein